MPELLLNIVLVIALAPRQVHEYSMEVEKGTTVLQVLRQNDMIKSRSELQLDSLEMAVWGRKVSGDYVLRAQDRLELLRPLLVDPKLARRERFAHQGAKKAGLFKTRRSGGKAGY